MTGNRRVDQNHLRMRALQHRRLGGKEEARRKMSAPHILLTQRSIRLGDAYKLNLRMRRQAMQEALNMAMNQPDDGHANRRGTLRQRRRACEDAEGKKRSEDVTKRGVH